MDMVGHQAVGPDRRAGALRFLLQNAQVASVVRLAKEHALALKAAMGHVMGMARCNQARGAGQADSRF